MDDSTAAVAQTSVGAFERRLLAMLADLEELVRCESPSSDLAAVARSADAVASLGERLLGVAPERIVVDGCTHLRWRGGAGPTRVLLLCHHDTVWPIGTLARLPWRVDGDIVRGPGCYDMKAGIVQALHAMAWLAPAAGVTLLVTGDEELGSHASRRLIEDEARGASAALVLEASGEGGALKVARKGVSTYELVVHGRASHAGLEPERGANAAIEAAHQVLAIADLADAAAETTVTPTVVAAGTTVNTVPDRASVQVDVRAWTVAEQQRVDRELRALVPRVAGTRLELGGGPNRPPLERDRSEPLFAVARLAAERIGLPLPAGVAVGGGSDGNLTAGAGTPTLDGLGAVGGGAHADDEHLLLSELPRRAALLAELVVLLLASPGPVPADDEAVR